MKFRKSHRFKYKAAAAVLVRLCRRHLSPLFTGDSMLCTVPPWIRTSPCPPLERVLRRFGWHGGGIQRLLQIIQEVANVFNSDRDPDQAVGNSRLAPAGG